MRFTALLVGLAVAFAARGADAGPALTFEERLAAQRAIEEVYWRHRTWPEQNGSSKPPLSAVMSDDAIRARVEDYLRKSSALELYWQRPVTGDQLQAELDRMTSDTRDAGMLGELYAALDDDPLLIAETLARQALVDRLIRTWYASDDRSTTALPHRDGTGPVATVSWPRQSFDAWWSQRGATMGIEVRSIDGPMTLDQPTTGNCGEDSWTATSTDGSVPSPRFLHTAVWTGSEMIVWGGEGEGPLNTGGRYNPALDTWTPTSMGPNLPSPREYHTAVWTGSEMIVWGGTVSWYTLGTSSGARYSPYTDSWSATSNGPNVPAPRFLHTAVWTGSEMIVWGGREKDGPYLMNTGGRYHPATDTWAPTSVGSGVPTKREFHTAVWTGSEMIVWGGHNSLNVYQSGARYDPSSDSWTPTALPSSGSRYSHTAVWTGSEMIVWGGAFMGLDVWNTGIRYDPDTNTWTSTSLTDAPLYRTDHTAVWTGSEMIVWGGYFYFAEPPHLNTGGRYDPSTDSWTSTSTGDSVPAGRSLHTAVWTGSRMIVWGGLPSSTSLGIYCAACFVPAIFHRDADGDGFGDPAVDEEACAASPGFVGNADDCDDASDDTYPGAAEICDGHDNDCDTLVDNAPAPLGATQLTMSQPLPGTARLSWTYDGADQASFDVVRGDLDELVGTGGDFASATQECVANDVAAPSVDDTGAIGPGQASWFLMRAVSCGGNGSYDSGVPPQVGSRDVEIDASGNDCD